MQRVFTVQKENKQLKIIQERDAQERDAFCVKIEQLQKQIDQIESELDLEKKKTKQLKSTALEEFYQSSAWFAA